jgi:pyruvate,water dikinase
VTVSCAEGDQGFVYSGVADYETEDLDFTGIPATRTKVMLNLANPAAAFRWWRLPADGVGLARMEFVISNHIKVHPMALFVRDAQDRSQGDQNWQGYTDRRAIRPSSHRAARIAAARAKSASSGWRLQVNEYVI